MQIYNPRDGLLHALGITVVLIGLVGWALLLKGGFSFVLWTHDHEWKVNSARNIIFSVVPAVAFLLSIYCLIQGVRRGFDPIRITLALGLFVIMFLEAILLVGTMTAGI